MRKTVCVVSLLIAVVGLGASSLSAAGMTFGVTGGLNVTKLTGDLMDDAKWRMVGVGGAFLCYKISDVFAIQPEMLLSMKGTKWEAETDEGNATYTWKLNYLEIPLLAKVYVPTESRLKPHIFAGPALDLKISSRQKLEIGGFSAEADLEDVKSTDIGIVAGAGFDYLLSSGCIVFEARFEAGLTSIDDSGTNALDIKNSAVSIMVGYGFAF